MANNYEHLDHHDVVSCIDTDDALDMKNPTFKVEEFAAYLIAGTKYSDAENWYEEGIEAKVLSQNKKWRKGKIRLSIEFCPDEPEENKPEIKEPESPLDELRKSLQN